MGQLDSDAHFLNVSVDQHQQRSHCDHATDTAKQLRKMSLPEKQCHN